jgi:hypothetical protein
MTKRPLATRLRLKLRRLQHDDKREAAHSTLASIIMAHRARLNAQHPDLSVAEIEAMLRTIIAVGMRPTKDPLPKPSLGIPEEVLAARRAERRAMVRHGRSARR